MERASMVAKPSREYRVAAHQEGYVVQSRTVASDGWVDGPIFLSQEKAEEATQRLVAWNKDVANDEKSSLLEGGITVSAVSTLATDLDVVSVAEISDTLRRLLADVFVLFVKTKSFHWHISGRHFREDHLLLDDHATQIFDMVDDIAERIRKIGGAALHSIGDIARHQRLKDNDADDASATDMLRELLDDNRQLTRFLRLAHDVCDRRRDAATAGLIENWMNESERRAWFLSETTRER